MMERNESLLSRNLPRNTLFLHMNLARKLKDLRTLPNVARNSIVSVAEIVCYDVFKHQIIKNRILADGVPCYFSAAVIAGFSATLVASPVDVVKTRSMNNIGKYKSAIDCAIKTVMKEGPTAFYKG
ncbi:hypothetical protein QYM36_018868 [Artemia franciscana]|uniref:Uncharacterized protein n=1 Tax=Artemia franciscana TaxID=6661 RepID=A0AA88KTJ1_ARTSF|nr:hypothetical protein QYM36_018868 [Artemia franciscana]